jgi:uncharacterized protein YdaU (DUF1376 family)
MSAIKTSFVALYPTDFLADVGHLGNTELGIYTRLLLVYYRDQRPLPSDIDKLRRMAMTFSPEEGKALSDVLAEFFIASALPDGTRVWRHKRADIELAKASEKHLARVRQTEAARQARHSKPSVTESVTASVTETVTGYSQTENQNQRKNKEENDGAARLEIPEWLPKDVWRDWDSYRRARKGWTRRAQELSLQTLSDIRQQGQDLRTVVDNAIERGWTKVYPIKGGAKASPESNQFAGAL